MTSAEGLTQFNLDLQPTMTVTAVTVNGAAATFEQQDAELVITPADGAGRRFAAGGEVTYGGQPALVTGGTSGLGDGGWYRTESGGAFVAGEPTGASAWYPVNEHPADTATFQVTATVPDKWKVISNGVRQTDGLPDPGPGKASLRLEAQRPGGQLPDDHLHRHLHRGRGHPLRRQADRTRRSRPASPARTHWPTNTKQSHRRAFRILRPLSLRVRGRDIQRGNRVRPGNRHPAGVRRQPVDHLDTVVHELAHQWCGDDVTIERWSDICLNECFASYGAWL